MEVFDNETLIIIGAVVLIVFAIASKQIKKDKEGRIEDDSVDIDVVIEELEDFKVEINEKLKYGYTEKSIQKQLLSYLRERFVHVTEEYGIEGQNATKIDFDIGQGRVGVEIKIALSVYKTADLHRLSGQIEDYIKYKYDQDNLLVIIFGEKKHTADRAMMNRVREKVEDKNAGFLYIEIPSKINENV